MYKNCQDINMDHIVKKLSPNDISLARQLILLFQTEFEEKYTQISEDNYLLDLLSKDSFHVFVAMKDEIVIGGLTAYELPMFNEETKEMFLYDIAVDKNHWQKGIAKELINTLKHVCGDKNIKIIFVGTDTYNEVAKKLYKSTGAEMEEIAWFTYGLGE